MKKRTGIFRLLTLLLTLVMFASMPLSAFATEAADEDIPIEDMVLPDPPDEYVDEVEQYSIMLLAYDYDDIPEEMLDNSILRALAYTGFNVQYLKDKKVLYNTSYIGSALKNNAPDVLSGIPYSHDGSGSGLQTVKDSSTPTGLAPDIAHFRDVTGLDCADFCAYYLCNYLPNIEGIDTSIFQDYRKELGYRPDDMRFWMAACADMDEKGLCDAYYLTPEDSRNNTEAYQEALANCKPGDLIRMGTETKDWVHYAIYAGTYNGEHYCIHVANDRGPEISIIRYQDNPSSSKWSVPLAFYHFYWNDTEEDGAIEIYKSDDNGTALAGAEFTATNNETGEKYVIGPTDSKGYAKADKIPYGTYTVVESKFPAGYQSSGTSSWTVTLDKNTPNGTVTINAVNQRITGELRLLKTTSTGENLGGWRIGVYTDAACTKPVTGSPFTTGADGSMTIPDLEPGTYYCKEIPVDNPYWVIDDEVKSVTVAGGQTATVVFFNTHYGDLRVKKNAVNGSSEDWNFQILDADKNLLYTITTGADGYATSPMLLPGTYYVREVHDRDEAYWEYDATVEKQVTVTAGTQVQVSYTNTQYGCVQIIKDLDTDGTLEGWPFKITDANGDEIEGSPFISQADGTILTGKLAPGQYTVEELIPEGSLYYCKTENPQTITVTAGETAVVTFTNALRPGTISVQKTDINGQPLAGAKFLMEWSVDGITWMPVTQSDSSDVIMGCSANAGTQVSPEDGVIEWTNLYPGIYYRITEMEAPEGYTLLSGPAFVGELPIGDLTVTLRVVNARTFVLPETGSNTLALMPIGLLLCAAVCMSAFFILRRKQDICTGRNGG